MSSEVLHKLLELSHLGEAVQISCFLIRFWPKGRAGEKPVGAGDFATEVAIPLVFAASLKLMGIDPAESPFWEEHLMRSMGRTVGQFGVPADAAASNHEGEAHLDELMRRRAAEIASGAEADTPDVISQILLADSNGRLLEGERIGLGHLIFSASTDAPAALLVRYGRDTLEQVFLDVARGQREAAQ